MFLFQKRTRNIIKVIWGIFAVLIIVSMIITYSGFTMLAGTTTQPELTQEELDALLAQQATSTATTTPIQSTTTPVATLTPAIIPENSLVPEPEEPPVPKLDFSL